MYALARAGRSSLVLPDYDLPSPAFKRFIASLTSRGILLRCSSLFPFLVISLLLSAEGPQPDSRLEAFSSLPCLWEVNQIVAPARASLHSHRDLGSDAN